MGLLLGVAQILAQASGPGGSSGGLLSNPWFYAVLSAVSMTVGPAVVLLFAPSRKWQAILLAVGGGSLVISLAFELFDPAFHNIGRWGASGYFVAGVGTFGGLDILIDRTMSDETEQNGWGLWASVTTDGVPENAAMGSPLTGTGQVHGALAFLFALVVTNGSQSMMSGTNMKENHGN